MDSENTEKGDVATPATDEGKTSAPSQKITRTEKEKAEFSLKSTAKRLKDEFGVEAAEILGIKAEASRLNIDEGLTDDTPLTVGAFREMQKQEAKKTALSLADKIADETERQEVKDLLSRLAPSMDAQRDFELAVAAINARRTTQLAHEQARKTSAARTAAGGTTPAQSSEDFVPTPQEETFMRPPYNMSKEKILAIRAKAQETE